MAIVFTYTKSTNTVVVTGGTSGTPATFADFVTADRAGSVTLLAAWAPISNTKTPTYQITPVEKLALLISFVIASKTAEADYIFITGTDAWDAAQTESIDVTVGSGTYVSTKRFRTITNIDCSDNAAGGGTVWADGTVAVTQPQWGVIWSIKDFASLTYIFAYKIDADVNIGDGSTSTYVLNTDSWVCFSHPYKPSVKTNATLRIGTKIDADRGQYGSFWTCERLSAVNVDQIHTGTLLVYDSIYAMHPWAHNTQYKGNLWFKTGAVSEFIGCIVKDFRTIFFQAGTHTWNHIRIHDLYEGLKVQSGTCTINDMVQYSSYGYNWTIDMNANTLTFGDVKTFAAVTKEILIPTMWGSSNVYFDDCDLYNIVDQTWSGSYLTSGYIWERYSCDINVRDKDGAALSGATVLCEDTIGTDVFSVSTAAGGNITQQMVPYRRWNYSGGIVTTTYSPHKFTISKAGYETVVLENITIDGPIDWHLELQNAQKMDMDGELYESSSADDLLLAFG